MSNTAEIIPMHTTWNRNPSKLQTGDNIGFDLLDEKESTTRISAQFKASRKLISSLAASLYKSYSEAKKANWDLNDAEPVSEATYYNATKLISALPLKDLPMPDILPDNDGYLEFEWTSGGKSFSIYVTDTNLVYYAGYYGKDDRLSGRFIYEGEFPENCEFLARSVFKQG